MKRWVYGFGSGERDGGAALRDLLGGKGANLAEMARLGLPVPPGFILTTQVCNAFFADGRRFPDGLREQVRAALTTVEQTVGQRFGDADAPLLVSVRSGARESMPGMMDTVLNLGLNDLSVEGLARSSGDARFAWDSYRRFVQMYGSVVLGVPHHRFEDIIERRKHEADVVEDTALSVADWRAVVEAFKALVGGETGGDFPQEPEAQLWGAVGAVFGSWMNPRANTYRRLHGIPVEWGTAVTVQAMVFGNMGDDCATGVCFTRDPSTGEDIFYGEYLRNAQGEDVVAGIRTPQPMSEARAAAGDVPLERAMPSMFRELLVLRDTLERHYLDMQDIEFTIQQNRLFVLQTRSGKRSAAASVRIAVEMAEAGLITREDALRRVAPETLNQLLHPMLDPAAPRTPVARGLPASPGAAAGGVAFDPDDVERRASHGEAVILVRVETSPEDIHGMHAARGVLTVRGGMTSHAAVVARGMGCPCVTGAGDLRIDPVAGILVAGGRTFRAGDVITIDGSTGDVFAGAVPTVPPMPSEAFEILLGWADGVRRLQVRANAETPADAAAARRFGAEGIGLCRTEHMFFAPDRISLMRQLIMAEGEPGRRRALDALLPHQRQDFEAIFRVMHGLPVTIRLLDPPLHEFLPHTDAEIEAVAAALGEPVDSLRRRRAALAETNPMLGHRGCRLGVSFPDIYAMQVRAIVEAAVNVARDSDAEIMPEIMIPLVATASELSLLRGEAERVVDDVVTATGVAVAVRIGTMIELPRAALTADRIARHADFFSFGTNDLTQTTFGLSRDDAGRFLSTYLQRGLLERDPFATLDAEGVGELIGIAVRKGRATRSDLKLGLCGEHGGDPASIEFCETIGLDYVSCSPFRTPVARLAAAQAALAASGGERASG